jgi:hypothetical protein
VPRNSELGSSHDSELDAHAIVLRASEIAAPAPSDPSAETTVVWSGDVQGDGSGPQRSYFVRLYANRTAHCQCPAFVRYVLPKARLVRNSPVRCGTAG